MTFQLVRASDNEIVVWHTEHGHIYGFEIPERASSLAAGWFKNVPEAAQDADSLKDDARRFATEEARSRRLLA